ncbi:MAG TPA: ester cyclase [Candidatus Limnocylindrales bacterium]|nr:ester cyclase [Candidatus Limnocylindrales bacterium]
MTSGGVAVAVVARFFEAVNRGDTDGLRELAGPGYVHHSGAGDLDVDQVVRALGSYRTGLPDFRYEVETILPVDDGFGAVARWTIRATQSGPFFGAPASGRETSSPGLSLHRVVDGRVVEDWEYGDDIAMFEALGFHLERPARGGGPGDLTSPAAGRPRCLRVGLRLRSRS